MQATVLDVGTPLDQSAAVSQFPSLGPVQVSVQSGSAKALAGVMTSAITATSETSSAISMA
jgi:hypothetical protein